MFVGRRYHPAWIMFASALLIALGLVLLRVGLPITALAIVVYGAGNGVFWTARGSLPLALFDSATYAVLIGRLALPSMLVQALSPSIGAALLESGGAELMLATLAALAIINVLLSALLLAKCQ